MIKYLKYASIILISIFISGCPKNTITQLNFLNLIKKIDIHTHISNDEPYIREILDSYNMKYVTNTAWDYDFNSENTYRQNHSAGEFCKKNPRYYAWITSFDLSGWNEPGWSQRIIKELQQDFDNGAVGVKIHSELGKVIQNEKGEYVQVDDPIFKPVLDFIAKKNKPLLIHIGEPLESWMPFHVPKEGVKRTFFDRNRKYSFWKKPDKPSYSEIIWARDNILENHPDLKVVGAHLGSLEYRVDEVAKRLDRYPNFAVEIGGRMRYLMWQVRGSVRAFFIKYQDRIMYGTDITNGNKSWDGTKRTGDFAKIDEEKADRRHGLFFRYLATDDDIPWGDYVIGDIPLPEPAYTVKGLLLPKVVLKKFFYENAVKWFPGIEEGFE
jgi:predicted TIM-barrel fold metal-dependent hydrolase